MLLHPFTSTFFLLLPLAISAPSSFPPSHDLPDVPSTPHDNPSALRFFAAQHANARDAHSSRLDKKQVKVRRMKSGHSHTGKRDSKGKRACSAPTTGNSSGQSDQAQIGDSQFAQPKPSGDAVFPVAVKNSWTTVQGRSGSLSFDSALKPLTAGKLPPAVSAPDGSNALQASYPANTVKYSASTGHGYSFYSPGDKNGVDVTTATEVVLSYAVYFSENFDWVKGGKLPGLYGGASLEEAKSCSGGRQDERDRCFSARMMWRANGAGELYNYFPISGKQPSGYCSTAPYSVCDVNYGDSIGRGSFYFPSSQWTTVTQRLKLNTPASASNGEQELFVNGQSVLKVTGLQIRVTDETKIYGIMAQTFFGGSDQSWASTKDQWAWFKDWSLGVVN